MKPLFVRPIRTDEAERFIAWVRANPLAGFDPDVALYPNSTTWVVYDEKGPLAYQTLQHPLMLESTGFRPDATEREKAGALRELTQNAVTQAHIRGSGEIYFLGTAESTNEFAKAHVFEELPYKVYRCRLKDLTKNEANHKS